LINSSGDIILKYHKINLLTVPTYIEHFNDVDDIDCEIPSEKSAHEIRAANFEFNLASQKCLKKILLSSHAMQ